MIDHKDISSEERLDECIEIVTIKKTDYGYEIRNWIIPDLLDAIKYCEDRNLIYEIIE